ncbi:glycerate kinase [Desulfolithobacter sp.]
MKIVIAPNEFKESLSAPGVAAAMAVGVRRAFPGAQVVEVPVADGGDGLVEVVHGALGGQLVCKTVTGPLFTPVEACFCHVEDKGVAVIEMALASGLALVPPEQRDPCQTTTFGTGELIRAALDLGVSRVVVGIGGSATSDGGIGMASALGVRFLDGKGQEVEPVGLALGSICHIDISGMDPRLRDVEIEAVCDVDNPLCGDNGAARVYAPQKGATPAQVELLDEGLVNLARVIAADLGVDVCNLPGAGAAGGLGGGLYAFLGARMRRGAEFVLDLVELEKHLQGADLVLTGEGQVDFQTASGKAPAGVARAAARRGIPCIALAGSVGEELGGLYESGISAVFSICPGPVTLVQAMAGAREYLSRAAEQVVRCYVAGGAGYSSPSSGQAS